MGGGNGRLRFGEYEFDRESGKLLREGWPVKIQPQPLRVLAILLEQPGVIVSREHLRARVWGDTTFVEFDQGLNYCVRQIRVALRDGVSNPLYIETLPKQGYRFMASVVEPSNGSNSETAEKVEPTEAAVLTPLPVKRKYSLWPIAAALGVVLAVAGVVIFLSRGVPQAGVKYTRLTDFTDSALAPALSRDGRMVAFIRGNNSFLTADQIWVKVLPNGEAKRVSDDGRLKYNVAFSLDGDEIAYTVLAPPNWETYRVSVLGGDSQLLLKNAAGLSWLDRKQLLYSEVRSGVHMGVVTGTLTHGDFRALYFPTHERAMAHFSYASPDRESALVVEMTGQGGWGPCRLISLNGRSAVRQIGPEGGCTSAGWSPDGSWMYFSVAIEGQSHLWRQRYPNGRPEQITFGPNEEEGVALERDGRSLITSMGGQESTIWFHDAKGERCLSSEGEVVAGVSPPSFQDDNKWLYYLLRRQSASTDAELWRVEIATGKSEAVFPGIAMFAYDVSPDGKQVVYSTAGTLGGSSQLWLAPVDRSAPARRIGNSGELFAHFGARGQILVQFNEGRFNYLERMNADGSGRSKVVPYPIHNLMSISPGRRWVIATGTVPSDQSVGVMAIPVDGGRSRRICSSYCVPSWSSDGKFLLVPVEEATRLNSGRSLAIPLGLGEKLPDLPEGGIKPLDEASVVPGAKVVPRADLVPGKDVSVFAYVNTTMHRNLYRVSLP